MLSCIPLFVVTSFMPPRKKMVTKTLTGVGENHRSKPTADHIFMHSEGVESFGETSRRETKGIMVPSKIFNVLRLPCG